MPRKLAAILGNNAWIFRKRVVADYYVSDCMHHHANHKALVRHRHRRNGIDWLAQAEGASDDQVSGE